LPTKQSKETTTNHPTNQPINNMIIPILLALSSVLPLLFLNSMPGTSNTSRHHRRQDTSNTSRHHCRLVRFRLPPRQTEVPRLSSQDFQELAGPLVNQAGRQIGSPTFMRRFLTSFGLPPHVVASAWNMIAGFGWLDHLGPRSLKPVHLLWGLMFMKGYATESDHAARAKCCETTFRKWAWFYVECLANLDAHLVSILLIYLFALWHCLLAVAIAEGLLHCLV
jgi:hypothetical protein